MKNKYQEALYHIDMCLPKTVECAMDVEVIQELIDKYKKRGQYPKLVPCKCGCNRRNRYYSIRNGQSIVKLECKKCGDWVAAETDSKASLAWNKKMGAFDETV